MFGADPGFVKEEKPEVIGPKGNDTLIAIETLDTNRKELAKEFQGWVGRLDRNVSVKLEEFTHHIFRVLAGPKENLQVYQEGTHGAGHLN